MRYGAIAAAAAAFAVGGEAAAQVPAGAKPVVQRLPPYDGYYDASLAQIVAEARARHAEAAGRCDIAAMREEATYLLTIRQGREDELEGIESAPLAIIQPSFAEERADAITLDGERFRLGEAANRREAECETYEDAGEYEGPDLPDSGAPPPPGGQGGTRIEAGVGYRWAILPKLGFLGREPPGAAAPALGLFESEREVSGTEFRLRFTIPAGGETDAGIKFGGRIRLSEGDSRAAYERTDMQGDRLVIPGLGGEGDPNRNGFVFNYFAGLNSPDRAEVTRDFVSTEAAFGVVFEPLTVSERMRWAYGIWGAYEAEQHEANFFAPVPGFARDIGYVQEIELDAFKLGASVGLEYDLDEDFTLGFELRGAAVFADYEGTNKLTFTGFTPQIVTDQGSGTSFDGDFTAFLEADIGATTSLVIAAGAFYSNGTPVWQTPGGGARASIVTDRSSGYSITALFLLHM